MPFFLLDPCDFQNPYLFHFLFNFNDLKCYGSATLHFTNHLGSLKSMEQLPRTVFNVQE